MHHENAWLEAVAVRDADGSDEVDDMLVDELAVMRDDRVLDDLARGGIGADDELSRMMAAWVHEVHQPTHRRSRFVRLMMRALRRASWRERRRAGFRRRSG